MFENYISGYAHRARILGTFELLRDISTRPESTYTFTHINSPHPPYVFSENGKLATKTKFNLDGDVWLEKENYLNQLKYINKEVTKTIDEIQKNSDSKAIIAIYSDHGTASSFYGEEGGWDNPSDENIKERMGNFSALFLPPSDNVKNEPYNGITPVNFFRLIFNNYFGESNELLPDKNFFSGYTNSQDYFEITDKVQ